MSTSVAHPVQTLREHSTNFEAALSVCLAEPKVKAVHKLRTESRRLEAQIALLRAMRDLPSFRTEAAKALGHVKKLRQAAGRVRDVDVQADHLQDHAEKVRSASSPDKEKEQELADVQTMLSKREHRRGRLATKLVAEIEARQGKVSAALEKLNSALKDAGELSLPSEELLSIVEREFAKAPGLKNQRRSADDLHSVRKAAKQARYLAENAGSRAANSVAKRYEDLQELGGAWHDWLELASAAREELGKKHRTAEEFKTLRDHNLERFRAELEKVGGARKRTAEKRVAKTKMKRVRGSMKTKRSVKSPK